MRAFILVTLFGLACSACTSGSSTTVRSDVRAEHVAAIAVNGKTVIVENLADVTLELRRRAATGEVIGVATLRPGESETFPAERRRTVELVNRSDAPAAFEVRVVGAAGEGGGVAYVGILAQNPL